MTSSLYFSGSTILGYFSAVTQGNRLLYKTIFSFTRNPGITQEMKMSAHFRSHNCCSCRSEILTSLMYLEIVHHRYKVAKVRDVIKCRATLLSLKYLRIYEVRGTRCTQIVSLMYRSDPDLLN